MTFGTAGRRTPAALLVVFAAATWAITAGTMPPLSAQAQTPAPALTSTIPVDPQITVGSLPNGLRYYVRANGQPANRAELRLVVNAGSVLEEDDQRGLAHFVEHMAFNGTERFPKQAIVTFMESIGMRFGPSVNAFTSFDETVYQLQIPTDRPDAIDKAFQILEDWAQRMSFDPAEIDKERGVIIEEWRLRRGAQARMTDQQYPVLFAGSKYADRLPIGTIENLKTFKHERLKQFYTDWYRPDLMAVIAVGDFDRAAVEKRIRTQFAGLRSPAAPRSRQNYTVPGRPGTAFAIATDPEARTTDVSVYHVMQPPSDPTTVRTFRQHIVEGLFAGLLNARFSELAQQADPPFLGAGAARGLYTRGVDVRYLSARVREDGILRGLGALFTENERVARFGFTQTELDRQKTAIMRRMEQAVVEKDKQESEDLAAEFTRAYLEHEPIPGIVAETELYRQLLPGIPLTELNALAREWAPDRDRVVMISAPQKAGLTIPDAKALTAVMNDVESRKDIVAYVDRVPTQPLLERAPTPGRITTTSTRDALGITEWQLSNGVKVVLKPTTFKPDEIVFQAFSPGGHSLASDADYIPASMATSVVAAGGVGSFSLVDLRRALTGKLASAGANITSITEGLSGSASIKDLETLFQLIYLRFTAPRPDPTAFAALVQQMRAAVANQEASPGFAFSRAFSQARYGDHVRARPMTTASIDQMNLDKSMAFYRDRFADAGDFTFVFVGSFDLAAIRPFVEQYLGGLPSAGRKETWKDVGLRTARGVIDRRVAKGIEPQSQTIVLFSGPFQHLPRNRVEIRALAMVLETRLRETLREDLGGTYSVGVSADYSKIPVEEYSLAIQFGSSPDGADALFARVVQEIEQLRKTPPTEQAVADVREVLLRQHETQARENGFYVSQIASRYLVGEDPAELNRVPEYYKGLTPASIQQAAETYFDLNNRIRVTLVPEK
jgi:zinc protease